MFEECNDNGILYRLIKSQEKDIQDKEPPAIIEEDEAHTPPQKFDDSSDDSSTEAGIDEQGYTKPLEISEMQTPEYIPESSEQDIIPDKPTVRTSSRNRKQITRFEDNPDTYNETLQHNQCKKYYNNKSKKKLLKAYKAEVVEPRIASENPQLG